MTPLRPVLAALALCAAPLPALAEGLSPGEGAEFPRLIDSACLDLVEAHTGCEQAILVASETEPDRADLIVLTDWRTEPASAPLLVARAIAFNGAMWGMAPTLEQAGNGSLLLRSEQSGIGRFPWFETLTLAWRDGRFVVAGFTWSSYDRAMGGGMSCDVNLLTGDYVAQATRVSPGTETETAVFDETGRIAPMVRAAADWGSDAPFPDPCSRAMAALAQD